MIAKIQAFIAALVAAISLLQAPPTEAWEPDPEDVDLVSRTIWGETRGCPSEEQEGVGWCIVLRKNSPQFPDTIRGVVTQPNQWQGYSPNNPAEPFWDMARDILIRDHNGEPGPLPDGFFWCSGNGKHQTFRDSWIQRADTEYWP